MLDLKLSDEKIPKIQTYESLYIYIYIMELEMQENNIEDGASGPFTDKRAVRAKLGNL